MTRSARLAATAAAALLLSACGETEDATPSPIPSASASASNAPDKTLNPATLATLLPTETAMEALLGLDLDMETKADQTQFHEGSKVVAEAGQVGFYRPTVSPDGAAEAGGYVALSLFATADDAEEFLGKNPNYDEKREEDPEGGILKVFDLSDVADEGTGVDYREAGEPPSLHTSGIARIGRVIVEVALFHGIVGDRITQTREVLSTIRGRIS